MNRSAIVLILAAACGAGALHAQPARPYDHRAYEPGRVMNGPPAVYYEDHDWGRECRAERWDANRRYFPGDAVRRKGELYVARGVSRNVYNVNSPPEWTPSYWSRARC